LRPLEAQPRGNRNFFLRARSATGDGRPIPMASASEEQTTFDVVLPPNATPGKKLRVTVPGSAGNTKIVVQVPEGAVPGATVSFKLSKTWTDARIKLRAAVRLQSCARRAAARKLSLAAKSEPPSDEPASEAHWAAVAVVESAIATAEHIKEKENSADPSAAGIAALAPVPLTTPTTSDALGGDSIRTKVDDAQLANARHSGFKPVDPPRSSWLPQLDDLYSYFFFDLDFFVCGCTGRH
jgi:hypothetical protein